MLFHSDDQGSNHEGLDESSSSKTKRRRVSRACIHCQRSHLSCDDARPCSRCQNKGIAHLCQDGKQRKRGKKRKSDLIEFDSPGDSVFVDMELDGVLKHSAPTSSVPTTNIILDSITTKKSDSFPRFTYYYAKPATTSSEGSPVGNFVGVPVGSYFVRNSTSTSQTGTLETTARNIVFAQQKIGALQKPAESRLKVESASNEIPHVPVTPILSQSIVVGGLPLHQISASDRTSSATETKISFRPPLAECCRTSNVPVTEASNSSKPIIFKTDFHTNFYHTLKPNQQPDISSAQSLREKIKYAPQKEYVWTMEFQNVGTGKASSTKNLPSEEHTIVNGTYGNRNTADAHSPVAPALPHDTTFLPPTTSMVVCDSKTRPRNYENLSSTSRHDSAAPALTSTISSVPILSPLQLNPGASSPVRTLSVSPTPRPSTPYYSAPTTGTTSPVSNPLSDTSQPTPFSFVMNRSKQKLESSKSPQESAPSKLCSTQLPTEVTSTFPTAGTTTNTTRVAHNRDLHFQNTHLPLTTSAHTSLPVLSAILINESEDKTTSSCSEGSTNNPEISEHCPRSQLSEKDASVLLIQISNTKDRSAIYSADQISSLSQSNFSISPLAHEAWKERNSSHFIGQPSVVELPSFVELAASTSPVNKL